jgi:hypothetical protein
MIKRVGVASTIEKMVENKFRWFKHVERRLINFVVKRVDQMKDSQITWGRERLKKSIREIIRKYLEINELDQNMVYDRTLLRNLIHIADSI